MLRGIAGCTASAGRRSCTPSISRNEPRHADRERHALLALPAQRCDLAHVRLSGYRGLRTRGSWHLCHSDKKDGVLRLRLLQGDHGAADGHDRGDDAIDALGALVLGGLRLPAGSWATATLAAIQRHTRSAPNAHPHPMRPHRRLPAVAARHCRLPALRCRPMPRAAELRSIGSVSLICATRAPFR
jgi:hypothetical protein